jgi:DNA replication and repair protein RecF
VIVERIELLDYRNYEAATFELTAGVTAVLGRNGQGKTNLAEAMAYLATLSSFRGAPPDALIRVDADLAVIRATIREDDGREVLIEAELSRQGRNRVQVNRQRLSRSRDLLGSMRVSVFAPDDLILVKGGPAERRSFLDGTLVALATKYDATRLELDRILRQRNVLLKQANGRLTDEVEATLEVWDARFTAIGEPFGHARATLVARCQPMVVEAYEQLAGTAVAVDLVYEPAWRRSGLSAALAAARNDDLRRGVSTVGPHRDDVEIALAGMPARTHASQGEQRTLALAMRLAAHRLIAERTGSSPVLVLDDVLSELDPERATALLAHLPPGQVIITSASPLPAAARPERILEIRAGTVVSP